MTDKISLLIVVLINIILAVALVDTNQNLNEGDSCIVNSTQQEGICTQKLQCNATCASKRVTFERCKETPKGPIVCCPKDRLTNSISAKKCLEYKEFACEVKRYRSTIDGPTVVFKVPKCAINVKSVIIGGEIAKKREFPHMALLIYGDVYAEHFDCGGTLISDRFVLSAAHCLNHNTHGTVRYVRLGEHDYSVTNDSVHIDVQVEEVIPHPNYTAGYSYNDIGLIKLERKVNFTIAIRPACLPEEPTTMSNATATGWGLVNENNYKSPVLMKVNVHLIDHYGCREPSRQSPAGINETIQFCAGSNTHSNNTCEGDSGGPLQVIHKHHFCTYSMVGVTSFGSRCYSQRNNSDGVYTRVFPYLDWIESIVWKEQ